MAELTTAVRVYRSDRLWIRPHAKNKKPQIL